MEMEEDVNQVMEVIDKYAKDRQQYLLSKDLPNIKY
jgi:hypothetical protein